MLPDIFSRTAAPTFLAPMQDVTDVNFMRTVSRLGAPDVFVTEYLRVHPSSRIEKSHLAALLDEELKSPVILQLIGEDEYHMLRIIDEAKKYPRIWAIDLNLGCPAPKVYRKNVGGALLKDPKKIASLLSAMRGAWGGCLSAKLRIGFQDDSLFETLLKTVLDCGVDFVALHARTVKQLYRGKADHSYTKRAVEICGSTPLVANGDITSWKRAEEILKETKCSGIMIGRSAMRNPWIFRQTRERLAEGKEAGEIFMPRLLDVREYVDEIISNSKKYKPKPKNLPGRLKKFLNFIALGVDSTGEFLNSMRRAQSLDELLRICDKHLLEDGKSVLPFSLEPAENLYARPNHED